jgi:hypothetical protein
VQFRVRTADGTLKFEGLYEIQDNGVLRISQDGDGKPVIQLSPAYWREITESHSYDIRASVY